MMKNVIFLLAVFACLLAIPSATHAALPDVGGNSVAVTHCTQIGNDIQVDKNSTNYSLKTACRQTEFGYKFYTMTCNSDTEYFINYRPCTSDELLAVTKNSCIDGDNGLDYATASWATGIVEGSTSMATLNDSCGNGVGDLDKATGTHIAERSCSNGYIHTQWVKCANGCVGGACKTTPTPIPNTKCTETDGSSYEMAGTATGNDEITGVYGSYPDTCGIYSGDKRKTSGSYLAETKCGSLNNKNYVHTQWYNCPFGCVSGACQANQFSKDFQTYDVNAKTTIVTPANNSILTNYPRTVDLTWHSIDKAVRYQVEVNCDECGATPWASVLKWRTYTNSLQVPALTGDNQYKVRVLPVFSDDSTGQWSDYSYFTFKTVVQSNLPACGDVHGGNTNFLVCTGYSLAHDWSVSRMKLVSHDGEVANVQLGGLGETDTSLTLNVAKTFYILDKPGKYLTATYLGIGAEGRALFNVDSNTTYIDSYSESCTNEKGTNGVYTICKNNWFTYSGDAAVRYKVIVYSNNYVWLKLSGAKVTNIVLKRNVAKQYTLVKNDFNMELTYLGKANVGGVKMDIKVTPVQ